MKEEIETMQAPDVSTIMPEVVVHPPPPGPDTKNGGKQPADEPVYVVRKKPRTQ